MRAFDPQVFDAVWQSVEALIPAHIDRHSLGCHRQRVSDKECFRVMLVRLVTAARGKTQSSSAPRWSRTRRSGRAVTSGSVLASSTPSPMRPSRVMTASSGSTSRTGPESLPPTARSVLPAPRCPDEDLPPPRRTRVVGHHSAQISVETCATARWIASRPATERFEPASRRERRVRRSTRAIIDRPDSSRVCAPGAREMSEDAARRARRVPADLEIGDGGARSRSRFGRPHDPAGRSSRGVRRWSRRRFHGTGRRLVISAWGGGAPGGTVLSNGAARRHAPDRGLAIMGPFLDVGSARPGTGVARAPWNQPTSVWAGRAVAHRFPEYCGRVFGPLRWFDRPPMVFHRRVAVQRSPSSAAATQGPDSSG